MQENPWLDIRNWGAAFGIGYGIWTYLSNRRETRLDALTDILEGLAKAHQAFNQANSARRSCERLKESFGSLDDKSEAKQRITMFYDDYNTYIKNATEKYREAEILVYAKSLRLSDKLAETNKDAFKVLEKYAKAVNNGHFDLVDQFSMELKTSLDNIKKNIRGMRLRSPIESLRKRLIRTPLKEPLGRYDLTEKQLETVTNLINKRAINQAGNSFVVHPPRKLLDRPEISSSDRVVEELEDESFFIIFQDGSGHLITLPELVYFVSQLLYLAFEIQQISLMLGKSDLSEETLKVTLKTRFSMNDLMAPDSVRFFLSKIEFSGIASDDETTADELISDDSELDAGKDQKLPPGR